MWKENIRQLKKAINKHKMTLEVFSYFEKETKWEISKRTMKAVLQYNMLNSLWKSKSFNFQWEEIQDISNQMIFCWFIFYF